MNKSYILKKMKIMQWRLCQSLNGAKPEPPFIVYRLKNQNSQSIGYLFISRYFPRGVPYKAMDRLINALFKATKLLFYEIKNAENLSWEPGFFAVVLGSDIQAHIDHLLPENACKIVTHDPATMLLNPACKRKVWDDLKPLRSA